MLCAKYNLQSKRTFEAPSKLTFPLTCGENFKAFKFNRFMLFDKAKELLGYF